MAYSDARKQPWHLDLTPAQMEEALAMWPLLYEVAQASCTLGSRPGTMDGAEHDRLSLAAALGRLDAQHPTWRTWLTVEHDGR
ncbi:MAG TPA: hypothetical protein VJ816_08280 [Gemmatimonadales bacterium]|nr:hypothetical protein [Gemmatimonadales bacterium]